MYGLAAPQVIIPEMIHQLPPQYRQDSTGPRAATRVGSGGTTLEGPVFDRAGNLFFTDIPHGRIFVARAGGAIELFYEYDGEPNGLKLDAHGNLLICDHSRGLLRLDMRTQALGTVCKGPEKEHFKGVNDLVHASDGALWFTDQGATGMHDPSGRVYRLGTDGRLDALVSNIPSPNGLVFNAKENVLYVAATRSSSIWLLPLTPAGGISKVGLFARLPGGGPDGLAADMAGNIACAHPSLSCVWLFSPRGIPTHVVKAPEGAHVTNIAYGGPDNRWLYFTDGANFAVWRAEMPYPGRPLLYGA